MQDKYTTRQLYQLVAGASNVDDFTGLLERLANEATDIRIKIPGVHNSDSIEIRRAIYDYLKNSLDSVRRIKDNKQRTSSDGPDGE